MRCTQTYLRWTVSVLVVSMAVAHISLRTPHKHFPHNQCPSSCTCNNRSVDCFGAGLLHVPRPIPHNTKILHLEFNSIERIEPSDIHLLIHLEALYLRRNLLKSFPHIILRFLPKLKILDISGNPLQCSCSLMWIFQQPTQSPTMSLRNRAHTVEFANRDKTHCSDKQDGLLFNAFDQNIFQGCAGKLRFKRNPGCTIPCTNGGLCIITAGEAKCQCKPGFYGPRCQHTETSIPLDEQPTDPKPPSPPLSEHPENKLVHLFVEGTGEDWIYVRWTVNIQLQQGDTFYLLVSEVGEVKSEKKIPLPQTSWSYKIDSLEKKSLFEICIILSRQLPMIENESCIRHGTADYETSSVDIRTDLNSPLSSQLEIEVQHSSEEKDWSWWDDKHQHNNNQDEFIHTAVTTLAAVFGVSAMLTILVGFLYYKRTHYASPPTSSPTSSAATTPAPPATTQDEVILVSDGNEIRANYDNPAFSHNICSNQVSTTMDTTCNACLPANHELNSEVGHTENNQEAQDTLRTDDKNTSNDGIVQIKAKPKLVRFAFRDVYKNVSTDALSQENKNV